MLVPDTPAYVYSYIAHMCMDIAYAYYAYVQTLMFQAGWCVDNEGGSQTDPERET